MPDASPWRGIESPDAPPDALVARIAAIDDDISGQAGRDVLESTPAPDVDPAVVTGLLDTVLLLRQSAAAVEPRVRSLVPMVIDMLDLPRHLRLQMENFGALLLLLLR